jgi:predicted ATP-dependent endonuclease of OLD family
MLVEAFFEISMKPNAQVIMTTHTPAICGLVPIESLRLVDNEDDTKVVKYNSDDVYQKIADTLGVLPEPFSNKANGLVLVEGKSDVVFLRHTFEDKNIAIVPIGGCGNLKHWRTQKIAEQFSIPWGILLDSDRGTDEEQINKKHVEKLNKLGIKAYLTRKREPENYIDINCIRENVFEEPFSDTEDVKKKINRAIKMSENDILEKLWPKMSVEQIRNAEEYTDDKGIVRYELTEIIKDFLSLVN